MPADVYSVPDAVQVTLAGCSWWVGVGWLREIESEERKTVFWLAISVE